MSPASFPPKAPTIRRPLPSTGSLRVGSPASSVLWSAPTPCHPSPQTSSPSPSDTASAPAYLLPSPEGCFPGRASGRDYRLSHSGFHSAEVTGPPRFLEDPNACMPCSSTPAEPCHSCCIMPGCCLPQVTQRRLPQRFFRGSITRPTDPLCTLRSLGCPRTTQHSVPAASTLCRVGLIAYRVPQRSFYFLLEASPPSRLCLAHVTQTNRYLCRFTLLIICESLDRSPKEPLANLSTGMEDSTIITESISIAGSWSGEETRDHTVSERMKDALFASHPVNRP
jgi:hypothetical protein